jgi:hypothetical protein
MLRRALGFFWPLDDGQRDRKSRLGAVDQPETPFVRRRYNSTCFKGSKRE